MNHDMQPLRDALAADGFSFSRNHLASDWNLCRWQAYRRSAIDARECECNDGKRMQIVVTPHSTEDHNGRESRPFQSVTVDVTGEAGGVWYKLEAYSLGPEEAVKRLPEMERNLIAAWNALIEK